MSIGTNAKYMSISVNIYIFIYSIVLSPVGGGLVGSLIEHLRLSNFLFKSAQL